MWTKRRTLLNVTVTEKGECPERFRGSVIYVEYESLSVSLMKHDRRVPLVVDFSECVFELGARTLLATRKDGEIFSFEDTENYWAPLGN